MVELALEHDSIWYEQTGDGPPLVFVHGAWMDGGAWDGQVERFADEFRVITVDLRGHGQTGSTDRRRYSIDLFVDDLEHLFDELDVEAPIVCGLSLGGIVAQAYLDRHPDAAAGAILAGPAQSLPPVDVPPCLKPFVTPVPGLAGALSVAGPRATFRSMLQSIRATTGSPWLTLDPEVRERAIDDVGEMSPAEYRKIFSALYHFDPPDLSHVRTPTLVVYGERESTLVKHQARRIARTVPAGRWLSIPEAAHLVNVDNPDRFNAAVDDFLEATAV